MEPTPRARQLLVPLSEAIAKLREALEAQAAFRPGGFKAGVSHCDERLRSKRSCSLQLVQRLQCARSLNRAPDRADGLSFHPAESSVCNPANSTWRSVFSARRRSPDPELLTGASHRRTAGLHLAPRASPCRASGSRLRIFAEIPHVRVMYPQKERVGSIDPILRSRGLTRRIAVTVPHYLTIPAIVAKSNLLGVVPEWLARRDARNSGSKSLSHPSRFPISAS